MNSKISALTSATTPLAGTETLPIVQSSTTKQVSVANLTAGRAVTTKNITSTDLLNLGIVYSDSGLLQTSANITYGIDRIKMSYAGEANIVVTNSTASNNFLLVAGSTQSKLNSANGYDIIFQTASSTKVTINNGTSDVTVNLGNIVQGTAAKGFDFSANTPAAGKTSTLLNWYEEGTWTPNQGGGLTVVGAFSSTGKYTRIGRNLRISGTVTGATSVAVAAAGVIATNLPFTVGTAGHGNVTNAALTSFAAIICTSTNITSAGAIAATGTLTFSATYFV